MNAAVERIRARLFALADEKYRDFNRKLIPTVSGEAFIGVRTPQLRALARELSRTQDAQLFMEALPHFYFEENNLHAFLLERIQDEKLCLEKVEQFLPYIDNWATCDQLLPKALARNPEALLEQIRIWLDSDGTYVRRFAIGMLMRHYLDANFREEYLYLVAAQRGEDYYLRMMVAWYFATALAKQYAAAMQVLERGILEPWTHNQAIQKALESRRISPEQKACLKNLREKLRKQS